MLTLIGVVLAGGRSSRMGRDKALLKAEEGTGTWLDRAIAVQKAAGATQVWISGGADRLGFGEAGQAADGLIFDIKPDLGPVGGVVSVLENLSARGQLRDGDQVIFMPVDMLGLDPSTLRYLVSELQAHPDSNAIQYTGQPMPFALRYSAEILTYVSANSVQGWLDGLGAIALEIPEFKDGAADARFLNLNTPAEWGRWLQ